MRLSICSYCGHLLQFENVACRRCGAPLGFVPGAFALVTLKAAGAEIFADADDHEEHHWRRCVNSVSAGCNWLVPASGSATHCLACGLNRNLADMSVPLHRDKWRELEAAKRRLVYALMRFGLPIVSHREEEAGLAFDFLAGSKGSPVMTGHSNGLITINIAEACSAERERQRIALGEPYRTLLGHFRHEIGHYYWVVLVEKHGRLEECREIFGDERESYAEALQVYYANGPKPHWEEDHISAYATMHPWEDFAETWTHYLHIVDTLDTAEGFGLAVNPKAGERPREAAVIDFDAYATSDTALLMRAWLPLTAAVNSLNRSMGQPDLYPFEPSEKVHRKLAFIQDILHPEATRRTEPRSSLTRRERYTGHDTQDR